MKNIYRWMSLATVFTFGLGQVPSAFAAQNPENSDCEIYLRFKKSVKVEKATHAVLITGGIGVGGTMVYAGYKKFLTSLFAKEDAMAVLGILAGGSILGVATGGLVVAALDTKDMGDDSLSSFRAHPEKLFEHSDDEACGLLKFDAEIAENMRRRAYDKGVLPIQASAVDLMKASLQPGKVIAESPAAPSVLAGSERTQAGQAREAGVVRGWRE